MVDAATNRYVASNPSPHQVGARHTAPDDRGDTGWNADGRARYNEVKLVSIQCLNVFHSVCETNACIDP